MDADRKKRHKEMKERHRATGAAAAKRMRQMVAWS
jgi:hypothetical protein